ncbi:MAG: hypothetical protein HKM93_10505 [Desulfobacteraceae bacterium]|nr:hypothetical protein [Desulfobacteraceae bacterium]
MARIPRIMITGESTAYHVISRTALDGYVMGGCGKSFLCKAALRKGRLLSELPYTAECIGIIINENIDIFWLAITNTIANFSIYVSKNQHSSAIFTLLL